MFELTLSWVNLAYVIFDWCSNIRSKIFAPDSPIWNENGDVQRISERKWHLMIKVLTEMLVKKKIKKGKQRKPKNPTTR